MINRYILIILISAFLLIGMAGAASGADIAPNSAENLAISGITQDKSPSLNVQDGAVTTLITDSNPRAPVRKRPTLTKTPVPTRVTTTAPTTVPTTITTTVPTKAPTTVPTTVPITSTATPNQAEIQARVDVAYADGYTRLAEMQAAYHSWSIPSRPDLIAIATNVKSAGIKGDGVTDDTVALQALLNRLPAGSMIYFPPAHYRIDGPITIAKPFTLFGESGTVFDCQKATEYVFTINKGGSASSPMTGMAFTGIVIEGPGIETTPAMIDGYYLQNFKVSYLKFHNIGYAAIDVRTSTDVTIEDCVFDNVFKTGLGYGVCIEDRSDRVIVRDNFFVTKGRHGVATGTCNKNLPEADFIQSVTVVNNYFEHMTEQAIDAHIQTTGPYTVTGNVIYSCAKGVQLRHGTSEITNNVLLNCLGGINLYNENVDPDHMSEKIDKVANNTIINNKYEAIIINRSNAQIFNNIAQGMNNGSGISLGDFSPDFCHIEGNIVEKFNRGFQSVNPNLGILSRNNLIKISLAFQYF